MPRRAVLLRDRDLFRHSLLGTLGTVARNSGAVPIPIHPIHPIHSARQPTGRQFGLFNYFLPLHHIPIIRIPTPVL